jgi:hypothetical protein
MKPSADEQPCLKPECPRCRGGDPLVHFLQEVVLGTSDRTVIIAGAAMLHEQLGCVLNRLLQPARKKKDDLFDPDRPLSSFSAKINLTERLAVLDRDVCRVLHGLRKTRNAFGHAVSARSLNDRPHSDRIKALVTVFQPHWTEFLRGASHLLNSPSGTMRALLYSVSLFLFRLQHAVKKPINTWGTQMDEPASTPLVA